MTRRLAVAAIAAVGLLGAACGSGSPSVGARLAGPTDVVPFKGITVDAAEVHDYLAVSSGRGNELRIVDLTNDKPVLGPTVVFPLSIPSSPRPTRLAAASLGDGGADLLVASSAGSGAIELVLTWGAENRVVDAYDLSAETGAGAGVEVLALAAAPVPGVQGQARVIAALSGGKLAVVTATRASDGSIALARPAVIRDVGFEAADLFVYESHATGTEGWWLFAASADDLDPSSTSEVHGVAQIAMSGSPDTWTAIPLDARAPTRLVVAGDIVERVTTPGRTDTFEPAPKLRVYAALDPSGCGMQYAVNCGLATLDPATRKLAADPSGEMDHRAPMPIQGVPLGIAIAAQPVNLPGDVCNDAWDPAKPDVIAPPYPNARLRIAPGTGQRCTSAIAAITSSDGYVYVYDLSRWGAPNDQSIVRSSTRTSVTGVTQVRPAVTDTATDVAPLLGFWSGDEADAVLSLDNDLTHWFKVWPGYTPTEEFHLGWQIPLPQMSERGAVIGRLPTGEVYLAAQADTGRKDASGNTIWALGPALADPANGVHAGDLLSVVTALEPTCATNANGVTPETTVASILPPDAARFPGGAVVLAPVLDANGQPVASCWDTAIAQSSTGVVPVAFMLRSSGHMLYGLKLGYLGRPEKDVRFTLQWHDESDPALTPEQKAIARKLRRFYYPGAEKCDTDNACAFFGEINPMDPGPMLSFRLGWMTTGGRTGPAPIPGEELVITTKAGVYPMARKPAGSGALPLGIAPVDRSAFIRTGEVIRFYVAYQDDQVFVFGPGESQTVAFSIR